MNIQVPLNKKKIRRRINILIVLFAIGITIFRLPFDLFNISFAIKFLGLIVSGVCAFQFVIQLGKRQDPRPGLVISDTGLIARTSKKKELFIFWKEVQDFEKQQDIIVVLKNGERFALHADELFIEIDELLKILKSGIL